MLGAITRPSIAHIPEYGAGTLTRIAIHADRIRLTFDLSYSGLWAQAEMIAADRDGDVEVQEEEAERYAMERWTRKIAPALRCRIDGEEITPRLVAARHEGFSGEIYPVPFSLYYDLELIPERPFARGRAHRLEIEDTVLAGEIPGKPFFLLDASTVPRGKELRLETRIIAPSTVRRQEIGDLREGDRLILELTLLRAAATPADSSPADGAARPETRAREGSETKDVLIDTLSRREGMSGWVLLLALLIVTLYGAAHALSPGHGKSMVAAYLVGTKGRLRDAVILGLATTFTHTITVYLLGILVFSLTYATTRSQGSLQNLIVVAFGLLSGLLLTALGLWLFVRRRRQLKRSLHGHEAHRSRTDPPQRSSPASSQDGHPSHHHHHGQDHDHHHHQPGQGPHHHTHGPLVAPGEVPRLRELLALGFSGGIIPCPAGLATILVGLQRPDDLLFALLLLVFFSIGLGGVLIAIGAVLITGKWLARDRLRRGGFFQGIAWMRRVFSPDFLAALDRQSARLIRVLPVYSCLFIAVVGIFFTVRTAVTGRTELKALLELARGWTGL